MYGYHSSMQPFARITVFNPLHVSKCAQLLSTGRVLGKRFQPFQVHIPYLLQFLVDYRLYGMGWLKLQTCAPRPPVLGEQYGTCSDSRQTPYPSCNSAVCFPYRIPLHPKMVHQLLFNGKKQTDENNEKERLSEELHKHGVSYKENFDPAKMPSSARFREKNNPYFKPRSSYCQLEVDTWASDIVTNASSQVACANSPSRGSRSQEVPDFMAVSSLGALWKDEVARRKQHKLQPPSLPLDIRRPSNEALYESSTFVPSTQGSRSNSRIVISESSVNSHGFMNALKGGRPESSDNPPMHSLVSWGRTLEPAVKHTPGSADSASVGISGDSISLRSQGTIEMGKLHSKKLKKLARLDAEMVQNFENGRSRLQQGESADMDESGSQFILERLNETDFIYQESSDGEPIYGTEQSMADEQSEDISGLDEWKDIADSQSEVAEFSPNGHQGAHHCDPETSNVYPGALPKKRKRRKRHAYNANKPETSRLADSESPYPLPKKPVSISKRTKIRKRLSSYGIWLQHGQNRYAPSYDEMLESQEANECPTKEIHYSNPADKPFVPRYLAGMKEIEKTLQFGNLEPFDDYLQLPPDNVYFSAKTRPIQKHKGGTWIKPLKQPPTLVGEDVKQFPRYKPSDGEESKLSASTQHSEDDFSREDIDQGLTIMSVEIHAQAAPSKFPDPNVDPLKAILFTVHDDGYVRLSRTERVHQELASQYRDHLLTGCIYVDPGKITSTNSGSIGNTVNTVVQMISLEKVKRAEGNNERNTKENVRYWPVCDELSLIYSFCWLVRAWDVDILLGYEVQRLSLGFISGRANFLNVPFEELLSRIPCSDPRESKGQTFREWDESHGSGVFICGRTVLNVWRVLRSEIKTNMYHFDNVCKKVLDKTFPTYTTNKLDTWWNSRKRRAWTINHLLTKSQLTLEMLDYLDVIGRACEMARLFGIELYSVFSRGSQYRVEAVLCRVALPLGYCLPSPSKDQVASQAAMECLPLVMEPRSRLYTSPVLVLDFQSLYPSVIIGYNICYSTCLGKLKSFASQEEDSFDRLRFRKLGFLENYDPPVGSFSSMENEVYVSPNGVVFTSFRKRRGILPRMLQEILDTRVMVKEAMKTVEDGNVVHKVLNAKQLALKMLANVTYGYTSAGFSGRMPCAEIADAIVQTGRSILENCIRIIDGSKKWNAEVVYGDTDSVFVSLPGKSIESAFRIGQEITENITEQYPWPIKLKFEKVYTSSILVSKKRYAGRMMEKRTSIPTLDCKGLELVRRDSCPIAGDVMENVLNTLFSSGDLSKVKQYLLSTWTEIYRGNVRLDKFIFSKEVRMGSYSDRGPLPPSALIAARDMHKDHCAEPLHADRIPYVVIYGSPGAKLIDLVVKPEDVVSYHSSLKIHGTYYISKAIIPPIQRLLSIAGADCRRWYAELPKVSPNWVNLPAPSSEEFETEKATISGYYRSWSCALCGNETLQPVCEHCNKFEQHKIFSLWSVLNRHESAYFSMIQGCLKCSKVHDLEEATTCGSLSCNLYYDRHTSYRRLLNLKLLTTSSDPTP